MWIRNSDTGKWNMIQDNLPLESYNNLKVDLEKVRFYQKCFSGALYFTLNDFDDLYPELKIDEMGYYFEGFPRKSRLISESNSDRFYNKYLEESAFTIKNLFTPDKLIESESKNTIIVDLSTTEQIVIESGARITIDGVQLNKGNRILIKDQKTRITLSLNDQQTEEYFKTELPVSSYELIEDNETSRIWEYYTQDNGIYEYDGFNLIKLDELFINYKDVRKLRVFVKLGDTNADKEFHLLRLKSGYFPVTGDNMEFSEKTSWIVRNRVDYNNVFDLNFYDILNHGEQMIFDVVSGITYSIPSRTIGVGEFGAIINNQDKISQSATYSISNIMSNKFKSKLLSIDQVDNFYWMCGVGGTLLKVSKQDFKIEKIELEEGVDLTCVSFYNNIYGVVVGKFNTIYTTRDGGFKWKKIEFIEFEKYSYNSCMHVNNNEFIVAGEVGVFIEFNFNGGNWFAYKRRISKLLESSDTYELVENINDLDKTDWTNIKPFTFSAGLIFDAKLTGYNILSLDVNESFLNSQTFSKKSNTYLSFSFSSVNGNFYTDNKWGSNLISPEPQWDIYFTGNQDLNVSNKISATFSLPINNSGSIPGGNYKLDIYMLSNYNPISDSVVPTYSAIYNYSFDPISGELILISGNNQTIICYDKNGLFTRVEDNDFIYLNFTQSEISDVMGIERQTQSPWVYFTHEKVSKFHLGDFNNFIIPSQNITFGKFTTIDEIRGNKITTSTSSVYLAGNNQLLKKYTIGQDSEFKDLDPTFNSRQKSRNLILDYDIASKVNFFDDSGNYRLPNQVDFPAESFNATFSFESINGEFSWLDYYRDSEKTFSIGTNMQDANVVKFSTEFRYNNLSGDFTVQSSAVGKKTPYKATMWDAFKIQIGLNEKYIIPNLLDSSKSEFIGDYDWIPSNFYTNYDLLLNKNIGVFKRFYPTLNEEQRSSVVEYKVGDVLRLESDVVDTNLTINRILYYYIPLGSNSNNIGTFTASMPSDLSLIDGLYMYLYTITNFNESIINSLSKTVNDIKIKNLNEWDDLPKLLENIKYHPVGKAYKMDLVNDNVRISSIYNELTAYYNLQTDIKLSNTSKEMRYEKSFIDFGYSPIYNIYSYLNRIDSVVFNEDKEFLVLPKFTLPGNNGGGATSTNVWVDSGLDLKFQSNKLFFGEDLILNWQSLLLNTFIDLTVKYQYTQKFFERLLIINKYYSNEIGAYCIEFDRKLTINDSVVEFVFNSRRKLTEISSDLQLLNNIQRVESEKTIQQPLTFTNLENPIRTKFSTDGYLKVLVSDEDIRKNISLILYTDENFQVSMNVLNLEKEFIYDVQTIIPVDRHGIDKVGISIGAGSPIKVNDFIFLSLDGSNDTPMSGLQIVTEIINDTLLITSRDYDSDSSKFIDGGEVRYIKWDPFLNYQPVDLYKNGSDSKISRSIEILPNNYVLNLDNYSLVDIDFNRFRITMVDGLSLVTLSELYPWVLEADISNALIGMDNFGLVWYSGIWRCGRWFGGTWIQGEWFSGDWYDGIWNSLNIINNIISVKVDKSYSDRRLSKWYNGRWFSGVWNNGTWYNGRWYSGKWKNGSWFNGIWNDGEWQSGFFLGGIWIDGMWESGIFNCDSNPAYWLSGTFKTGDFENGIWYNGLFGNESGIRTRFGTRATNTRTSTWHSGNWIDGEFHSFLNIDSVTKLPIVSDIHKYSIWKTGIWNRGNFYGGIVYNIDFRGGTWHGGILEEIQVIGIDNIQNSNRIYLNGIFKFNIGDFVWIIDDNRGVPFSPIGNNDKPMNYRINKIVEDSVTETTALDLNFNLSRLGIEEPYASTTYSVSDYDNLDLGLRVVSKFNDVNWKSGVWKNGIFIGGKFDSGIWFNGIFEGNWGN